MNEHCKDHADAPHGFNRNASHNEGRYVCDCESWEPNEPSPSRQAFEKWWSANMNLQEMDLYWTDNTADCEGYREGYYICHETQRSWMAWQAASEYVCSLVNDGKS